jgi:hypothetical protein
MCGNPTHAPSVKIEVTSHNQSGGITAGNVGGNVIERAPTPNRKARWSWWRVTGGVVGFVSGLVVVLDYFGYHPWK